MNGYRGNSQPVAWWVLVWLSLLLLAGAAAARPERAASWPVGDPAGDVPVTAAAASSGDVLIGRLIGQTGGTIAAVAANEELALIGEGPRLAVVDLADPAAPVVIGRTPPFLDVIQVVATDGAIALAAGRDGGLHVIDLADPAAPVAIGFLPTSDSVREIALDGRRAIVAAGYAGLLLVDLADPAAPAVAGSLYVGETAWAVAVSGDYAYVASGGALRVVEISDPAAPVEVGAYRPARGVWDVATDGHYAYVAGGWDGLLLVDVSRPDRPIEVGQFHPAGAIADAVIVDGFYAYVVTTFTGPDSRGGVQIVNIANPTAPFEVGTLITSPEAPVSTRSLALAGDRPLLALADGDLRLIDITDRAAPVESGRTNALDQVADIAVDGRYAYAAAEDGLRVFDVADPAGLVEIGRLATPGRPRRLVKSGATLYLVDGLGFHVIDTTDPAAPSSIGYAATPFWSLDLALMGDHIALAGLNGGLHVYSLADPAAPVVVWHQPEPAGTALDVAAAGDYVYSVEVIYEGFRPPNEIYSFNIFHAADPAAMERTGQLELAGNALAVDGDQAYLARYGSLVIVDITYPDAPAVLGSYPSRHYLTESISLSGRRAYLAQWDQGLEVVDGTDPAAPRWVGGYDTPGTANGVAIVGDRAYVADGDGGLVILEFAPAAYRSFLPFNANPEATGE